MVLPKVSLAVWATVTNGDFRVTEVNPGEAVFIEEVGCYFIQYLYESLLGHLELRGSLFFLIISRVVKCSVEQHFIGTVKFTCTQKIEFI